MSASKCRAFWWCDGDATDSFPAYFGPVKVCRHHVAWAKKYGMAPKASRSVA